MIGSYLWSVCKIKPVAEYVFAPPRKFRFDWAFPDLKIACEQEGGIWIKGRSGRGGAHSLPSNILRDMEKGNLAASLGWRVFRFQPRDFIKGTAQAYMAEVINQSLKSQ